jgi:hypothetical protein
MPISVIRPGISKESVLGKGVLHGKITERRELGRNPVPQRDVMYSKLVVVNARSGALGDSDLDVEAKLLYGNVCCDTRAKRNAFERKYCGEAGQKLGLLFPDETVEVGWRDHPWTTEELLN